MAPDPPQTKVVPLTCHGHSRPITHLSFSGIADDEQYYLITACKDNHPILRSGTTGDWIGTFIGHKGAVWSARLSQSASLAATGSADFSAKIWDTHTGTALQTLQHNHIVRAVAFPAGESNPKILATGGAEKKLRLWDLNAAPSSSSSSNGNGNGVGTPVSGDSALSSSSSSNATELGPGRHTSTIKSILFTPDSSTILVTATEDKVLRWFDLRSASTPLASYTIPASVGGVLGSCEMSVSNSNSNGSGNGNGGESVISVAAGNSVTFLSGSSRSPATLIKTYSLDRDCSSVALNLNQNQNQHGAGGVMTPGVMTPGAATPGEGIPPTPIATSSSDEAQKFITASKDTTWVHVHSYATGAELEVGKGHHGPVWSTAYSPDGRLYATGSEDGTVKLWKAVEGSWGLWR